MSVSPILSPGSVHLADQSKQKLLLSNNHQQTTSRALPVSSFPHLTKNVASRLARIAANNGGGENPSSLTFDLLKRGENGSTINNSNESLDSNASTLVSDDSVSTSSSSSKQLNPRISQGNMSNSASISSSLYYVDYNNGQNQNGSNQSQNGGASSAPPGSLASSSNRSSICSNSTLTQSSISSYHLSANPSLDSHENKEGEGDEGDEGDSSDLPPPPPELRIGAPMRMFSAASSSSSVVAAEGSGE